MALCLGLVDCGAQSPLRIPPRLAGQLPPDYRLDGGRGIILARFSVTTQEGPGFGAITNPMLVESREEGASGTPDEHPQGLSLASPRRPCLGVGSRPADAVAVSRTGLMVASFKPGTYDGLVIAYPDAQHDAMPDSIPAPSRGLRFEPIEVRADVIVYVGTILIRQRYGFWTASSIVSTSTLRWPTTTTAASPSSAPATRNSGIPRWRSGWRRS